MANNGKLVSIWDKRTSTWKTFGEDWNDVSKPNEIIRTPMDYKGYSTTAVDSSRNSDGRVVAQPVIEDVAKIEVKWNFLTVDEFSKLSKLFVEKYGGSFFVPVAFFDETLGDYDGDNTVAPSSANDVRIFYPNDRVADFAHITLVNGKPVGYSNVSLHLIDTGWRYDEYENR